MTPLPRLCCISLYFGSGWRDVVVLAHGRKWLTGFTAATLESVKIPADIIQNPKLRDYSRSRLARRLRANAKLYPHSKAIATAIAELGRKAP